MRAARLLAALTLVLLTSPALAEPSPSPAPLAPEAPLVLTVTDLLPRAPEPGDAFEVVGLVHNAGTVPVERVSIRLRVGDQVDSRGGLHEADTDRPLTSTRPDRTTTVRLDAPLAPGARARFDLRTTVDALGLGKLGVYPLDIEARGDVGDGVERLGLVPTWIPWFAGDPVERTRVAVVWPLVDTPREQLDGTLRDDDLGNALSARGRLGTLLAAARAAATPECGGAARSADGLVTVAPTRCESVPVTYAVDPDLVATAATMADGYKVRDGRGTRNGAGGAAAAAWLASLKEAAAAGAVLALPYADPDVTALTASDTGGFGDDLARAALLGTTEVRERLGTEPLSRVAWPPAGAVTAKGLSRLAQSGATAFVLDPSAYGLPDTEPYPTPGARSLLPGSTPSLEGLVSDTYLSELVSGALATEIGPRLAEQRFLAETAIIAAEGPRLSRTLLVAPERRGGVVAGAAAAALRDLGRIPWLCPVTLSTVAAGTERCSDANETARTLPEDRGPLSTSRTVSGIDLAPVGADRDVADQLTDAVLSDQSADRDSVARITSTLRRGIARAESSAWRSDPRTGRAFAAGLSGHVDDLVGRIKVYGGQVLLTSTSGRLQVSLENRLDVPIRVKVRFDDRAAALDPVDTGLIEVTPGNAVPATVRATTQKSGQYVVYATVLDRNGIAFPRADARQAELIVRSTGYGRLALAVTVGGAGVLFVAAGVRIVRRARHGRQ